MTEIIDAHHHVWDPARRPQGWLTEPGMEALHRPFTPRDLLAETTAAGVSRTVLVQVLPDHDETVEFLAVAARVPEVAAVVGWADLTSSRIADTLAELKSAPGGAHLAAVR